MTADKMRILVARDIALREGESEDWILNEMRECGMFDTWTDDDFRCRPIDTDEIADWLFFR